MNNEKSLLYKIIQANWGEKTKDDWDVMLWNIYDDLSVKYKIHFGTGKTDEHDFNLTQKEIDEINNAIESAKLSNKKINGVDGVAWQFTKYENNSVVWERELGYIYGIEPLEAIKDFLNDKTDDVIKYSIDEKENVPQFVYGIPDFIRKQWEEEMNNENKYDVEPNNNVPREVYGIPKAVSDNESKYEIKPEDNVPQKVYGIPNAGIKKTETKVAPPIEDKIIIKVKNSNKDYGLIVKIDKKAAIASVFAGETNRIVTSNDFIGIPSVTYYMFYRDLRNMLKEVDKNYNGTRDITWKIEINRFGDEPEVYQGNGEVPNNWNDLMDLFAKMDSNYKK